MSAKHDLKVVGLLIVGVVAFLGIGTATAIGAVALSRDALPGAPLYSLQGSAQDVELALDISPQSKAASNIAFATTNVADIQAMIGQTNYSIAKPQDIQTSTADLIKHTQAAAQQITQAANNNKPVAVQAKQLSNTTQTAIPTLQQALVQAPPASKPQIQSSITQLATTQQSVQQYTGSSSSQSSSSSVSSNQSSSTNSSTNTSSGSNCYSSIVTQVNGAAPVKQESNSCNAMLVSPGTPAAGNVTTPAAVPTAPKVTLPAAPPYAGPISKYTGLVTILSGLGGSSSSSSSSSKSSSKSTITQISTNSGGPIIIGSGGSFSGSTQSCTSSIYSDNNGVVTNEVSHDCNSTLTN